MGDGKEVSRRDILAATGAALLPAMTCSAAAQAPPGAPQGGPGRGPGAPGGAMSGMPRPQQSVPLEKTPLFEPEAHNQPIGVGKGIFPGRVVWVHNPEVATWDGKTGEWWEDAYTSGPLVEKMMSRSLQGLSGKKTDKEAWDSLFRHFNKARHNTDAGYKPGEKITIKMNSNRDQYPDSNWDHANISRKGMASPHVVNALIRQLVDVAGVPGEDIVLYDVASGRYISDPIYKRILANSNPTCKKITFMVNTDRAVNGRVPPVPDLTIDPLRWSNAELAKALSPIVAVPTVVVEAKYRINMCVWRAHDIAAVTLCAKNNFGSIYWPPYDYWGPRPLHSGWIQRTRPMGSYSVWADITAHNQLGLKNMLYIIDGIYTAQASELDVSRFVSFGDHWTASLFMSQDPVAIDSVAVDFLRSEPRQIHVRGSADNYLHESALIEDPPSKTRYMPSGVPVKSLGVHEHWNNPVEKKYSRNLGKKEGIELLQLKA